MRKAVTFSYLNLSEDAYPSLTNNTNGMDVILCRNVLMYFTEKSQRKVVGKLYRCLVKGGWLMVSPAEISSLQSLPLSHAQFSVSTIWKNGVAREGAFKYEGTICPVTESTISEIPLPPSAPAGGEEYIFTPPSSGMDEES